MEDECNKSIGIGMINPAYIEVNELQDKDYEYKKIRIEIIILSESDNVCFEYYVEDELIRKNIYYVIGGI